ncbi:MAG: hypothetical protein RL748_1286, partial [Pseudomonadota bacterium]
MNSTTQYNAAITLKQTPNRSGEIPKGKFFIDIGIVQPDPGNPNSFT